MLRYLSKLQMSESVQGHIPARDRRGSHCGSPGEEVRQDQLAGSLLDLSDQRGQF